ncbi:MAG: iron-sulfur cluster assembly accessory protein [Patescibacteria group bacterium]
MADSPKFEMTQNAIAKVKELKKKMNVADSAYFSVGVAGGGCSGLSYRMGFVKPESVSLLTNHVFTFGDLKVAIDQKSMQFLDGTTLDYADEFNGGWKWTNPNAGPSCGCGESFAPKI